MVEAIRLCTTPNMDSISDSGRVFLRDGLIHYESDVYGTWSLPLSSVRAIGEFTNQDGPGVDDWFLLFLTSDTAYEASCYAEGRDRFLQDLSAGLWRLPRVFRYHLTGEIKA